MPNGSDYSPLTTESQRALRKALYIIGNKILSRGFHAFFVKFAAKKRWWSFSDEVYLRTPCLDGRERQRPAGRPGGLWSQPFSIWGTTSVGAGLVPAPRAPTRGAPTRRAPTDAPGKLRIAALEHLCIITYTYSHTKFRPRPSTHHPGRKHGANSDQSANG